MLKTVANSGSSGGGGGTPGGPTTSVQVNAAGTFMGYADFTYTLATKTVAIDNLTLAASGFNGSGTPAITFTGTSGKIYISAPGPSFNELFIQVPAGGGSLILGDASNTQFQFLPNGSNPHLSLQGHGGIYYIDSNTWSTGTGATTGLMDIQLRNLIPGATLGATMTDGFVNLAGAAGPATGTPSVTTGLPTYYDTTNNKLMVYNGGWKTLATPFT